MTVKINKKYFLFLLLFYTFIFNDPLVKWLPFFKYEDEALALLAIPVLIYRVCTERQIRNYSGCAPWLAGFILFTLLGTVYFGYQPFSAVWPDVLLCLKFWLCIYVSKEIFREFDLQYFAQKIYFHIKVITWLLFGLSLLNMFVEIFPYGDHRFGMNSNRLFYTHPVNLVSTCAFLMIILIALRGYIDNGGYHIVMLSLVMMSTLRSKGFAQAAMFLALYGLMVVKKQRFTIRSLLPMLPGILLVGWSQIDNYFLQSSDESARAVLLTTSFEVASDHFPLGAGFATYGSYQSQIHYSPLYEMYGLDHIWGLSQWFGDFICDSFWPMMLGQSGYLGTFCFIGALVMLIRKLMEMRLWNVYYYVSGLAAVVCLLLDSTSGTAFVHPLSMPIAMWIGIMLAKLPEKQDAIRRIRFTKKV